MSLLFTSWCVIYLMLNVTYKLPRWHLDDVKLNTLQCLRVGSRWKRTSSWSKEAASSNPPLNTPQSSICKAICGTSRSKEIAPGNPVWIYLNPPSVKQFVVAHEEKKQQSCAIPLWMHLNINFLQHFLSIPNQDSRNTLSVYTCQAIKTYIRSLQWSEEWPWTTHMSMRLQGKTRQ
jgi:hypothetical protein